MRLGPGSRVADRYTIVSSLGRGGVATVWLVRHEQLHTLFALKVLSLGSPRLAERLVNEARIQAMLKHPNVVGAVDLVQFAGGVGLVLEYVAGPTLKAVLAQRRLSPAEVHLLFSGIAGGVACAHRAGLVHRDLKPANVLLELQPALVAKVTDFGLAKLWASDDSGLTRTGATLGTPAYMAPEQVRDPSSVDGRADVFALGAVAYEMLTGVRAFEGDNPFDTLGRVMEARYPPLREQVPDVPESMVRAIEGALVPDPADRLPSVEALLAVWGEHEVPPPVAAGLAADAARVPAAHPVHDEVDPAGSNHTWSESDRSSDVSRGSSDPAPFAGLPAPPSLPPATQQRPWPGWAIAGGAVALFAAGIGVARLTAPAQVQPVAAPMVAPVAPVPPLPTPHLPMAAPPAPRPVPIPEISDPATMRGVEVPPELPPRPQPPIGTAADDAAPAPPIPQMTPAQRAMAELTFLMTDVSTENIQHGKDLEWLRTGLPGRVAEVDAMVASISRQYPDDEVVLQAMYQAGMIRFLSWSYRAWNQPPQGLAGPELDRWKQVLADEIVPDAWRSLDEARARFEALEKSDHPRAGESLWPRLGRQMTAQIDNIARPR